MSSGISVLKSLLTLHILIHLLLFINTKISVFFCLTTISDQAILCNGRHQPIFLTATQCSLIIYFVNILNISRLLNKLQFCSMKMSFCSISILFSILCLLPHILSKFQQTIKSYHKNNTYTNRNK